MLFIHFLQGFSVISYLNIFKTDLYEKMPKAKKIFKTFLEDHIGISIFFSLLSTGIQSFVVHIGSGGEGKVEFEPKISLLGLLFLTTIFYVLKVCLQVLFCFNKLLMFYGSVLTL